MAKETSGGRTLRGPLNLDDILNLLLEPPADLEKEVPVGVKENVAFVVNNETNIQRQIDGGENEFLDDCGSWVCCSSAKTMLVKCGKVLRHVTKDKSGKYCILKTVEGKQKPVPMEPQPDAARVIQMQRHYSTSEMSSSYIRTITWLNGLGQEDLPRAAVYEYLGTYPGPRAKHHTSSYVQCKEADMKKNETTQNASHDYITDQAESITDITCPTESIPEERRMLTEHSRASGGIRLKGQLNLKDILSLLLEPPNDPENEVPIGIKENVAFVVNNETNVLRQLNGGKRKFLDDCGAWTCGSSPKSMLIQSGEVLRHITRDQSGKYLIVKRISGMRVPVLLEPQPDDAKVIQMQRHYSTSKMSSSYTRRITWLNGIGQEDLPRVAVYEYLGTYPGAGPHGNSKHQTVGMKQETAQNASHDHITDQAESMSDGMCPTESMSDGMCPTESMPDVTCPTESMADGKCTTESMSDVTCPTESMADGKCTTESMSDVTDSTKQMPEEASMIREHTGTSAGIPLKGLLCLQDILSLLVEPPDDPENEVPVGIKENVAFVVNNETNVRRRLNGDKSKFWDDCGVWMGNSSPRSMLVRCGKVLRQVSKDKSGKYCTGKRISGRRKLIPMEPQPDDAKVIQMQRQYSTSKMSSSYTRRITWLNGIGQEDLPRVAVYEYLGTYPGSGPHGNSKHQTSSYVRSKKAVMTKLQEAAQNARNDYITDQAESITDITCPTESMPDITCPTESMPDITGPTESIPDITCPTESVPEECSMLTEHSRASGGITLKGMLNLNDILSLLLEPPNDPENEVPIGIKENVAFVVNNETNVLRRINGRKSKFLDDCGSWKYHSSPKPMLVRCGKVLQRVTKDKSGKYCVVKGMCKPVPMEPQPDEARVVKMERHYSTSKMSSSYTRRITWLNGIGQEDLPRVAVYEYLGRYPGANQHGNSKDQPSTCVRIEEANSEKILYEAAQNASYEYIMGQAESMTDATVLTESVSGPTVPTESVSDISCPTESVSGISCPIKSVSDITCSTESVSDITCSTESVSDISCPTESVSDISCPIKSVSDITCPTESVSDISCSTESVSDITCSTESVSDISCPTESVSDISCPTESVSDITCSTESVSDVSCPIKSVSDITCSTESMPDDTVPTKPTAEELTMLTEHPSASGGNALKGLLNLKDILDLLLDPPSEPERKVPVGIKENVAFVVDNDTNIQRRLNGQKSEYFDDCGAWICGSSPRTLIVRCGTEIRQVAKDKSGKYCISKSVRGKRRLVPLEPQPDESRVLQMQRHYATLKISSSYTRRITWLLGQEDLPRVAVYEYLGAYPGARPRDNSKDQTSTTDRCMEVNMDQICEAAQSIKHEYITGPTESIQDTTGSTKPTRTEPGASNDRLRASGGRTLRGPLILDDIMNLLLEPPADLEKDVPVGVKENVVFVVNNEANVQRRMNGRNNEFLDDCGSWICCSSPRTMLVRCGKIYRQVTKNKSGKYCIAKRIKGLKKAVPIEPQPDEARVVKMQRHYATSEMSSSYTRRITWLNGIGQEDLPRVAVYEYLGTYPGGSPRNNLTSQITTLTSQISTSTGQITTSTSQISTSTSQISTNVGNSEANIEQMHEVTQNTNPECIPGPTKPIPIEGSTPNDHPCASGGIALRKPLELEDTLNLLLKLTPDPEKEVPVGIKENVAFVVDNETNVRRRINGKKSEFWDDCGVWTCGSSPKTTLVRCGKVLRQVTKDKSGKYCFGRYDRSRRKLVLLEPQPDDAKVIQMQRYYSTSKMSSSYTRRITWLLGQEDLPRVAVYEYLGAYPGAAPHGNCKYQTSSYVRRKDADVKQTQEAAQNAVLNKALNTNACKDYRNRKRSHPFGDDSSSTNHGKYQKIMAAINLKPEPPPLKNVPDHSYHKLLGLQPVSQKGTIKQ